MARKMPDPIVTALPMTAVVKIRDNLERAGKADFALEGCTLKKIGSSARKSQMNKAAEMHSRKKEKV